MLPWPVLTVEETISICCRNSSRIPSEISVMNLSRSVFFTKRMLKESRCVPLSRIKLKVLSSSGIPTE